ncbi:hypothetical protein JMJ35_006611 [Cladonia borealis]|uniref:6-methylsalicylate decarboxylase n=1 Tax=Cladonia borealis TaxID=184061 RepID=A0AA39QZD0_9LECA|nr:hypothetical protein JMJ35_006611 [Cladonia borealis]
MPDKIDVHHHFVPPAYAEAFRKTSGDPSGWGLPKWNIESSKKVMATQGIRTTILSLTAPGCTILPGEGSTSLARAVNQHAASIHDSSPSQFGFFAALPTLHENVPAAIAEAAYALDHLHADGITLYTRYGPSSNYLGHRSFTPLWEELNRRSAVVFIHPTHAVDTSLVNPRLPQPIIDYPHETGKTAVDLIMSGAITRYPNVKIILSHAGGTLPYLATRAAHLTCDYGLSSKPAEEFLEEAKSFYYDLALSGNEHTLGLLLGFARRERVLFGTDFPYAPVKTIETNTRGLEGYELEMRWRYGIARGNALALFPRLMAAGIDGRDDDGGF